MSAIGHTTFRVDCGDFAVATERPHRSGGASQQRSALSGEYADWLPENPLVASAASQAALCQYSGVRFPRLPTGVTPASPFRTSVSTEAGWGCQMTGSSWARYES